MKKAVILFSGGLDSTTCLALAKSQGFACYALSFNYHQKHVVELVAAKKIAAQYQAVHRIIELPVGQFSGSALTEAAMVVPDFAGDDKIPSTYVPARNTIFLSYALGWAEVLQAQTIFIGANALDYSGYPDCRPEYIAAFEKMANLATKAGIEGHGVKIHTPLINLSKKEIIQLGLTLGIDYQHTVSCYRADAEGRACGKCDSCTYRKKGFLEAGIADATHYF
jgi:7-cyano-7-deazaguanine synthase